jgi:hypothetical protein
VLVLSLLAVLAGAEAFTDIARFGGKKQELLRRNAGWYRCLCVESFACLTVIPILELSNL